MKMFIKSVISGILVMSVAVALSAAPGRAQRSCDTEFAKCKKSVNAAVRCTPSKELKRGESPASCQNRLNLPCDQAKKKCYAKFGLK